MWHQWALVCQQDSLTKVPALMIKWGWEPGWIRPQFLPRHRMMMAGSEHEDVEPLGCPPSPSCWSYRKLPRWRLCCILFRYGTPAIKILLGYPPFHRWGNRFWGNVFLLRGNTRNLSSVLPPKIVFFSTEGRDALRGRFWLSRWIFKSCVRIEWVALEDKFSMLDVFKQRLKKLLTSFLQRNSSIIQAIGLNLLNSFDPELPDSMKYETEFMVKPRLEPRPPDS